MNWNILSWKIFKWKIFQPNIRYYKYYLGNPGGPLKRIHNFMYEQVNGEWVYYADWKTIRTKYVELTEEEVFLELM